MATLKQCDRCKFTGPPLTYRTVVLDEDRSWDLCKTCFEFIDSILCDGGKQWIIKPVVKL